MASLPSPRLSIHPASSVAVPASAGGGCCDHRRHAVSAPIPRPSRATVLRHRCLSARNPNAPGEESGGKRRWDSLLHDAVQSAVRKCGEYLSSYWETTASPGRNNGEMKGELAEKNVVIERRHAAYDEDTSAVVAEEWGWERWKRHFALVEDSERLVDELKLQLRAAVAGEDYRRAHKFKLLIADAEKYDTVGKGVSELQSAIEGERYWDAAFLRDHLGTGLLGWWSGLSGNASEPFGLIIKITAEHGRYVAKSYNLRQLASADPGFPVFEIYFAENDGEYKEQAVYLRPRTDGSASVTKITNEIPGIDITDLSDNILGGKPKAKNEDVSLDDDNDDEIDLSAGLDGLQSLPRDIIPILKVKVLKVVAPGKVDSDYIFKITDQILDEEDDDDLGIESSSSEVEDTQNESDSGENELDSALDNGDTSDIDGGLPTLISFGSEEVNLPRSYERIPAKVVKQGHWSFSLHVEQELKQQKSNTTERSDKKIALQSIRHGADILPDLAKLIGSKKKVSLKILKIGRKRSKNAVRQGLFGVTHFSRIPTPIASDPLNGMYAAASSLDSEIVYLKRKFGQWPENDTLNHHRNLEFYEYVEAIKLLGDHLVPAGQVVFRAKVGKHYQLPHKDIIPRELGVVARYKGQGRVADEGFKNPRWVDGELLVLDGKFIRDGPVIAFLYWTTNMHLFEFFNRLKLPD